MARSTVTNSGNAEARPSRLRGARRRALMAGIAAVLSFPIAGVYNASAQHDHSRYKDPVRRAEESFRQVKERATKYFEEVRFAYQLERRLHELEEQAASRPRSRYLDTTHSTDQAHSHATRKTAICLANLQLPRL